MVCSLVRGTACWVGKYLLDALHNAIPVIDCGGQECCLISRIPHFLDNWLTEIVSNTCQFHFIHRKYRWYSFLLEAKSTPEPYCSWKDR
jgi:hypothetical protein